MNLPESHGNAVPTTRLLVYWGWGFGAFGACALRVVLERVVEGVLAVEFEGN